MNYIELINAFWAKAQSDNLRPIPIACYFAIVHYCNQLNWHNPFVCHWHLVCQFGNFSKNSFYDSIKILDELGYIEYKKGNRNTSQPKVTVLELKNNKGTVERTIKEQQREQQGNLYKHTNNETIKPINREKIDFTPNDFKEPETLDVWHDWLEFHFLNNTPINRVRQPYVKQDLRKLATINGRPHEPTMRAIIKKCISMDWKNLQLTDDMKAELNKFKNNGAIHKD